MKQDKWIWMPHPAHFICCFDCRFHLATYVGKYIVSTVGEFWPERGAREIHAEVWDSKWLAKNIGLKGDAFNSAYFKRFGYEDLGYKRKFETMVFKAIKSENICCPYKAIGFSDELDFCGYNSADEATKGHYRLCKKWSNKGGRA